MATFTARREGFCINCGRTGLAVDVTWDEYRSGPPPAEVPAHCERPACQLAKTKFDAIRAEILKED